MTEMRRVTISLPVELEQRHQQDQAQITRLKALLFDYIRESGYTMDEVYA